jgi:hypothetical protein
MMIWFKSLALNQVSDIDRLNTLTSPVSIVNKMPIQIHK